MGILGPNHRNVIGLWDHPPEVVDERRRFARGWQREVESLCGPVVVRYLPCPHCSAEHDRRAMCPHERT